MTLLLALVIGVVFAVSVYLMTAGELKLVCMGVFLLAHGANLTILISSRSPAGHTAPVLPKRVSEAGPQSITDVIAPIADPLPQALILTAIVIGFAVQAFILTLIVITYRRRGSLLLHELEHTASEH